jgi:hypothetical protein
VKTIFTIGVYGADAEGFLAALDAAGVNLLLDVRQRRGVRGAQYAWANAGRLEAALREADVGYQHLPELAPTTAMREVQYEADAERGEGKRDRTVLAPAYVERYTEEIVERDAAACHRSLIAARLARDHGARIVNLRP